MLHKRLIRLPFLLLSLLCNFISLSSLLTSSSFIVTSLFSSIRCSINPLSSVCFITFSTASSDFSDSSSFWFSSLSASCIPSTSVRLKFLISSSILSISSVTLSFSSYKWLSLSSSKIPLPSLVIFLDFFEGLLSSCNSGISFTNPIPTSFLRMLNLSFSWLFLFLNFLIDSSSLPCMESSPLLSLSSSFVEHSESLADVRSCDFSILARTLSVSSGKSVPCPSSSPISLRVVPFCSSSPCLSFFPSFSLSGFSASLSVFSSPSS